jgi:hypothetical protein
MVFLSIGSKQIEHSSLLLLTLLKSNFFINITLNTMYIKDVIISIIENKQIRNKSLLSFRIKYNLFDTDCSVVII